MLDNALLDPKNLRDWLRNKVVSFVWRTLTCGMLLRQNSIKHDHNLHCQRFLRSIIIIIILWNYYCYYIGSIIHTHNFFFFFSYKTNYMSHYKGPEGEDDARYNLQTLKHVRAWLEWWVRWWLKDCGRFILMAKMFGVKKSKLGVFFLCIFCVKSKFIISLNWISTHPQRNIIHFHRGPHAIKFCGSFVF